MVPQFARLLLRNLPGLRHSSSKTAVDFTVNRYKVVRGPYTSLKSTHVSFFDDLLGKDRVITDPQECEDYNIDFANTVRGKSALVLRPKNADEVANILSYCNKNRLAVCPQSGNTGLVGGSTPVFDEIVLSMKLMNKIIDVNPLSGVLICQAGCVLQDLENRLAQDGLMMPLDLGAKGSCLIGGCVSTNAGGIRLLRYGNLHGNILGLEAVLANGTIVNAMSSLKKNNTGYHTKHLFIGSEGTLGVVTRVAIQCPPLPKAINVAFLGLDSFEKALQGLKLAKQELGEILSSYELMDELSMDVSVNLMGQKSPLSANHKFYVLIETAGSNMTHDEEKLNSFVEKAFADNIVQDGTLSAEPGKIQKIWALREGISQGVLQDGYVFKYDISLPHEFFYKIVEVLRDRLGNDDRIVRISGYGHLGDGNVHVQVSTTEYYPDIAAKLEPFIFNYISTLHGSVSAEHGIGFKKTKYLKMSRTTSEINVMHSLKEMMDPKGILNPYKVLHPPRLIK